MQQFGVLSHPGFVGDMMRRAALAKFFAPLPAEIEDRNEIAARCEALSRLTDNELAAIGIGRADLARAAVLGADG